MTNLQPPETDKLAKIYQPDCEARLVSDLTDQPQTALDVKGSIMVAVVAMTVSLLSRLSGHTLWVSFPGAVVWLTRFIWQLLAMECSKRIGAIFMGVMTLEKPLSATRHTIRMP